MAVKKKSNDKKISSSENKTIENKRQTNKTGDNSILCSILSYFIVGIIWYFVDENMKRSSLVKRHVKQAIVLLLLSIVVNIASIILNLIPIIGWVAHVILSVAILILWLIGIIHAAQGKDEPMPIIGEFSQKLGF